MNNPHKIQAVFFDMDGVLYDSMPTHSEAWVRAMTQFGYDFTTNDCYLNEGRTGDDTINQQAQLQFGRDATREEMDKIYAFKSEIFEHSSGALPMPFANNLLQKIKQQGRQIVLVTGSGQASLLENLNRDFPDIFNKNNTVTAFDVTYGKPNPEPYLLALKKAGCKANEAIVVENAPLGIEAAKAANLFVIAVNTGTLSDKILYDYGANIVFSGIKELHERWDKLDFL
ncbi:MAG: HAD-IA family hydrolase [Paludibacter sp.]|nr:HAD-IA family hydrolase [Paludibacter sp.]